MQRRRFVAVLASLAASLAGCSRSTTTEPPADTDAYVAFLLDAVRSAAAEPQAIVVRSVSVTIEHAFRDTGTTLEEKVAKSVPPAATPVVVQSFLRNASRGESIDWGAVSSRTHLPIRVVSDKELQSLLGDGLANGWSRFYDVYPNSNGVMAFSRIGWDAMSSQALLYVENGCGPLCGTGMMILLSRGPTGWSVVADRKLWMS
jgi:hypothetical protein